MHPLIARNMLYGTDGAHNRPLLSDRQLEDIGITRAQFNAWLITYSDIFSFPPSKWAGPADTKPSR